MEACGGLTLAWCRYSVADLIRVWVVKATAIDASRLLIDSGKGASRRVVQAGHVAAEAMVDALSMATLMRRSA